jgi:hypothetical protein
MKTRLVVLSAGLALSASGAANGQLLYDNGPLQTHTGTGAGGANVSVLQTAAPIQLNTYGFGVQLNANRIADDFTVPAGQTWNVTSITLYGYQTGAVPPTPTIDNVNIQIWNGPPDSPTSTVVFGDTTTNRFASATFANMYRPLDTNMADPARAIFTITVTVATALPAGTYWLDWNMGGSTSFSGPWQPPVTILGQQGKPGANAKQSQAGLWVALADAGNPTFPTPVNQDAPFKVNGTSTGGGCYANCDGSTTPPILNVNDFICFQGKYAAGDPTANCDESTTPPVLNVNDFICFQGKYAAGCP